MTELDTASLPPQKSTRERYVELLEFIIPRLEEDQRKWEKRFPGRPYPGPLEPDLPPEAAPKPPAPEDPDRPMFGGFESASLGGSPRQIPESIKVADEPGKPYTVRSTEERPPGVLEGVARAVSTGAKTIAQAPIDLAYGLGNILTFGQLADGALSAKNRPSADKLFEGTARAMRGEDFGNPLGTDEQDPYTRLRGHSIYEAAGEGLGTAANLVVGAPGKVIGAVSSATLKGLNFVPKIAASQGVAGAIAKQLVPMGVGFGAETFVRTGGDWGEAARSGAVYGPMYAVLGALGDKAVKLLETRVPEWMAAGAVRTAEGALVDPLSEAPAALLNEGMRKLGLSNVDMAQVAPMIASQLEIWDAEKQVDEILGRKGLTQSEALEAEQLLARIEDLRDTQVKTFVQYAAQGAGFGVYGAGQAMFRSHVPAYRRANYERAVLDSTVAQVEALPSPIAKEVMHGHVRQLFDAGAILSPDGVVSRPGFEPWRIDLASETPLVIDHTGKRHEGGEAMAKIAREVSRMKFAHLRTQRELALHRDKGVAEDLPGMLSYRNKDGGLVYAAVGRDGKWRERLASREDLPWKKVDRFMALESVEAPSKPVSRDALAATKAALRSASRGATPDARKAYSEFEQYLRLAAPGDPVAREWNKLASTGNLEALTNSAVAPSKLIEMVKGGLTADQVAVRYGLEPSPGAPSGAPTKDTISLSRRIFDRASNGANKRAKANRDSWIEAMAKAPAGDPVASQWASFVEAGALERAVNSGVNVDAVINAFRKKGLTAKEAMALFGDDQAPRAVPTEVVDRSRHAILPEIGSLRGSAAPDSPQGQANVLREKFLTDWLDYVATAPRGDALGIEWTRFVDQGHLDSVLKAGESPVLAIEAIQAGLDAEHAANVYAHTKPSGVAGQPKLPAWLNAVQWGAAPRVLPLPLPPGGGGGLFGNPLIPPAGQPPAPPGGGAGQPPGPGQPTPPKKAPGPVGRTLGVAFSPVKGLRELAQKTLGRALDYAVLKYGAPGKELSKRLKAVGKSAAKMAGRTRVDMFTELQKIFPQAKSIEKMPKRYAERLTWLVNYYDHPDYRPSTDPRVQAMDTALRPLADRVRDYVKAHGIELEKRSGRWISLAPNEKARIAFDQAKQGLDGPELRELVSEMLRMPQYKRKKAEDILRIIVAKQRQLANYGSRSSDPLTGKSGYLEDDRLLLPPTFVELDWRHSLSKTLNRAWVRAASMVEFGGKDLPELKNIYDRMTLEPQGGGDLDEIRMFVAMELGARPPRGMASPTQSQFANVGTNLTTLVTMGLSPFTTIRNSTQFLLTSIPKYGVRATLSAYWQTPPLWHFWSDKALLETARKFERHGVINLDTFMHELEGGKLRKSVEVALRGSGMTRQELVNQVRSATASMVWLQKNRKAILANAPTPRLKAMLMGLLMQDTPQAMRRQVEALDLDPNTVKLVEMAQAFVEDSQMPKSIGTKSLMHTLNNGWWPALRVATLYKSFSAQMMRFTYRTSFRELVKHGNAVPFARWMLSAVVVTTLSEELIDRISGRGRGILSRLKRGDPVDKVLGQVMKNVAISGFFGPWVDAAQFGLGSWLAGPAGSTAARTATGVADSASQLKKGVDVAAKVLLDRLVDIPAASRTALGIYRQVKSHLADDRLALQMAWRLRAREYSNSTEEWEVWDSIADGVDLVRTLVGGAESFRPGDLTPINRWISKEIEVGDFDDAAAAAATAFRGANGYKEKKEIEDKLQAAGKRMSPLGSIKAEDMSAFLRSLPEDQRQEARQLQREWILNWTRAVRKARLMK